MKNRAFLFPSSLRNLEFLWEGNVFGTKKIILPTAITMIATTTALPVIWNFLECSQDHQDEIKCWRMKEKSLGHGYIIRDGKMDFTCHFYRVGLYHLNAGLGGWTYQIVVIIIIIIIVAHTSLGLGPYPQVHLPLLQVRGIGLYFWSLIS